MIKFSILLRLLKIKCGFICARSAIISVSAIFCFSSASCLIVLILVLTNQKIKPASIKATAVRTTMFARLVEVYRIQHCRLSPFTIPPFIPYFKPVAAWSEIGIRNSMLVGSWCPLLVCTSNKAVAVFNLFFINKPRRCKLKLQPVFTIRQIQLTCVE